MSDRQVRACPVCAGVDHQREALRHRLPLAVAGVPADFGTVDFELIRCRICTLAFKAPLPPQDEIHRCYEAADAHHWEPASPEVRRFDEFAATIADHHRRGRILDVGCSSGDFLAYLSNDYEKFGIDPGKAAAATAAERGISILGADLSTVDAADVAPFDVIVALDVIEHVPEPVDFLRSVRGLLSDDGIVCILTGDTDCLGWRLEGGDYWYSALPEHLTFFNEASLTEAASRSGLKPVSFQRTRHKRFGRRAIAEEAARNALYVAATRSGGASLFGDTFRRSAPVWETGRNHFFAPPCAIGTGRLLFLLWRSYRRDVVERQRTTPSERSR